MCTSMSGLSVPTVTSLLSHTPTLTSTDFHVDLHSYGECDLHHTETRPLFFIIVQFYHSPAHSPPTSPSVGDSVSVMGGPGDSVSVVEGLSPANLLFKDQTQFYRNMMVGGGIPFLLPGAGSSSNGSNHFALRHK